GVMEPITHALDANLAARDTATLQILQTAADTRAGTAVMPLAPGTEQIAIADLTSRMRVDGEGNIYLGHTRLGNTNQTNLDPLVQTALANRGQETSSLGETLRSAKDAISNTVGDFSGSNLISLGVNGAPAEINAPVAVEVAAPKSQETQTAT